MKKYIATLGNKYLVFEEWESNMTGYGGSTESHYTVKLTSDINKASLESKKTLEFWLKWYKRRDEVVLREAVRKTVTILLHENPKNKRRET